MVCGQLQAPPVLSLGESGPGIHCTEVRVDLRAHSSSAYTTELSQYLRVTSSARGSPI